MLLVMSWGSESGQCTPGLMAETWGSVPQWGKRKARWWPSGQPEGGAKLGWTAPTCTLQVWAGRTGRGKVPCAKGATHMLSNGGPRPAGSHAANKAVGARRGRAGRCCPPAEALHSCCATVGLYSLFVLEISQLPYCGSSGLK